jgi:CubicO group peptidase (beta-lactamase class C family)
MSSVSAPLAERLKGIQKNLDEMADTFGIPGAAIGVLHGDETATLVTGVANVDTGLPVTADTVFQIGSNTKLYTATVAMMLVEQGRLALDQCVTDLVPEFRLRDADAAAVTIRHLLTHSAGFMGDYVGAPELGWCAGSSAAFVEGMSKIAQVHPVGAMWSYCNSGWVLLGRVIEKVTGLPYDRAVTQLLLKPLGGDRTRFRPEEIIPLRVAVGHGVDQAKAKTIVIPFGRFPANAPAGSVAVATAADVLAFVRMHLDGGVAASGARLLTKETCLLMQQPQIAIPPLGRTTHWGFGWALRTLADGQPVLGHGGSAAGQVSALEVVPGRRLAVVVLTNAPGGATAAPKLADAVLAELAGAVLTEEPECPEEQANLEWDRYVGSYSDGQTRIDIAATAEGLQLTFNPPHIDPELPVTPPFTVPLFALDRESFAVPGVDTAMRFLDFDDAGRPRIFHNSRAFPRVTN